ncbi:partner and localizer of BRCA2 [Silurus asotus]|uniref:Partner and localizer of BRCA2 n=1 Tax=Silurus asotus TaxID=30991 RepID=A0AAD5AHD6_SILAS|nr:partner and localizer of BRCA2 [Silurus asotus]
MMMMMVVCPPLAKVRFCLPDASPFSTLPCKPNPPRTHRLRSRRSRLRLQVRERESDPEESQEKTREETEERRKEERGEKDEDVERGRTEEEEENTEETETVMDGLKRNEEHLTGIILSSAAESLCVSQSPSIKLSEGNLPLEDQSAVRTSPPASCHSSSSDRSHRSTDSLGESCSEMVQAAEQTSGISSMLTSCTLIEGLPFPVEYYVRTTRRMASARSSVDLNAVIQSQLSNGRGRRRSNRGRGTSRSPSEKPPEQSGCRQRGRRGRGRAREFHSSGRSRSRSLLQSSSSLLQEEPEPVPSPKPSSDPAPESQSHLGSPDPQVYPIFRKNPGMSRSQIPLCTNGSSHLLSSISSLAQGLRTKDFRNLSGLLTKFDVQDFHLPDDEFGQLKLERLCSSCSNVESFVYNTCFRTSKGANTSGGDHVEHEETVLSSFPQSASLKSSVPLMFTEQAENFDQSECEMRETEDLSNRSVTNQSEMHHNREDVKHTQQIKSHDPHTLSASRSLMLNLSMSLTSHTQSDHNPLVLSLGLTPKVLTTSPSSELMPFLQASDLDAALNTAELRNEEITSSKVQIQDCDVSEHTYSRIYSADVSKIEIEAPEQVNHLPISHHDSPLSQNNPPLSHHDSPLSQNNPPLSHHGSPLSQNNPTLSHHDSPLSQNNPPLSHHDSPLSQNNPPLSHHGSPLSQNNPTLSHHDSPLSQNNPPLSQNNPPLSHHGSPLSQNNPPLFHHGSPLSQNNPPLFHHDSPLSQNNPPLFHHDFPLSQNNPQVSHHDSPLSQNNPPLSHHDSPLSQNNPPLFHHDFPLSQNNPPLSHHDSPLSQTNPPLFHHDSQLSQTNPPLSHHGSPLSQNNPRPSHHGSPLSQNNPPLSHHCTPLSQNNSLLPHHDSPLSQNNPPISHYDSPLSQNNPSISHHDSQLSQNNLPVSHHGSPLSQNKPALSYHDSLLFHHDSPLSQNNSPLSNHGSPLSQNNSPLFQNDLPISQIEHPLSQNSSCLCQSNRPPSQTSSPVSLNTPLNESALKMNTLDPGESCNISEMDFHFQTPKSRTSHHGNNDTELNTETSALPEVSATQGEDITIGSPLNLVKTHTGGSPNQQVEVLSCGSLRKTHSLKAELCKGALQAVLAVSDRRVTCCSSPGPQQNIQVFTLAQDGRITETLSLASTQQSVQTLVVVEEEKDALIGWTEHKSLLIWNMKSGRLLQTIHLAETVSTATCLRGYSYRGALCVLLQQASVFQSGLAVWNLAGGVACVYANESSEVCRLARWAGPNTLLTGYLNGDVSVYEFTPTGSRAELQHY